MKSTYSRTVGSSSITVDITYNQNTDAHQQEAQFIDVLMLELGYRKLQADTALTLAEIRAKLQNIDR